MSDLITWLRTQLDEDERLAGGATTGPWLNDDRFARDGVSATSVGGYVADCQYDTMGPLAVSNATFIAHFDPTRVLAEVEAKRRILDAGKKTDGDYQEGDYIRFGDFQTCSDNCGPDVWWAVVQLLALPYAGRPGYREEWRP